MTCPSCSRQKGQDSPVGVCESSESGCRSNATRTMPIEVQTSIMSRSGSAVRMAWAARGERPFNTSTSMASHAVKRRVEQACNIRMIIGSTWRQPGRAADAAAGPDCAWHKPAEGVALPVGFKAGLLLQLIEHALLELFLCLQLLAGLELDLLLQTQLLEQLKLCLLQGLQLFACPDLLLVAQLIARLRQ